LYDFVKDNFHGVKFQSYNSKVENNKMAIKRFKLKNFGTLKKIKGKFHFERLFKGHSKV